MAPIGDRPIGAKRAVLAEMHGVFVAQAFKIRPVDVVEEKVFIANVEIIEWHAVGTLPSGGELFCIILNVQYCLLGPLILVGSVKQ